MKEHALLILLAAVLASTPLTAQDLPKPGPRQEEWQKLETTAFLHFPVNTLTGKEWGDGTESPQKFYPTDFDAWKMVKTLKDAGFKIAIITGKHHNGFCLWPSKYTDHTVASSPWKNGQEYCGGAAEYRSFTGIPGWYDMAAGGTVYHYRV